MMNWINKKRNKKGFTLVELVVVIAILGILAGIAVPKLSKSRENAAIAAHVANVRTLESAATLAVSEGVLVFDASNKAEWVEAVKEDVKSGDVVTKKGWGDYLQAWPKVPTGLEGVLLGKDKDDKDITIKAGDVYKVEITSNGQITVTPGKPVEK